MPDSPATHVRPWQQAWAQALYADAGFYRRPEGPAGHFRTSVHAHAETMADAVAYLAQRHDCGTMVDIGAGRGELLSALAQRHPDLTLHGMDVVPRPEGLAETVRWTQVDGQSSTPDLSGIPTNEPLLVLAHELLDVIPQAIFEVITEHVGDLTPEVFSDIAIPLGVDGHGRERHLPAETWHELPDYSAHRDWLCRWWPLSAEGERMESGLSRDNWWAALAGQVPRGVLVAVDYAHTRNTRPPLGSLSGFRAGRQVPPVPDASCDITSEVAWDSLREAAEAQGWETLIDADQATVLAQLPLPKAVPAELTTGALGGFRWLVQRRR